MAVEITMPQLSDTMHEGKILKWFKQEGDKVKRGEALAEVATDKADLEIESFHEGTVVKIFAGTGTTVKVGSVIAMVGESGESVSAPRSVEAKPIVVVPPVQQASTPVAATHTNLVPQSNGQSFSASDSERIKISPLARNLADNYGVDYRNLPGSGEGGRIVRKDIERAAGRDLNVIETPSHTASVLPMTARAQSNDSSARNFDVARSTEPLSKMRQTIASRMVESASSIPHFYVTTKVNVEALKKLKSSLKPLRQYEGLTYNHLIIRAAGLTLRIVPRVNSAYKDGSIVNPQAVNIGIITAVTDGLLIPIVKNADQLPLIDIVSEARGLVQRARAGRPKSDDLNGGTFCISNMGNFGVESFTAIISPGQGAILAVSPIQDEAVVVDGTLQVGSVMRLTLSVDHRIIDGLVAGEFLTELKRLLEDPVLLLA